MKHDLEYKNIPKYKSYVKRAKKKFPTDKLITEIEFNKLSRKNCNYCDKSAPNGIDRRDNTRGYTIKNCVPCCKHCNYAKGNLSIKDFNIWKKRLIEKHSK